MIAASGCRGKQEDGLLLVCLVFMVQFHSAVNGHVLCAQKGGYSSKTEKTGDTAAATQTGVG